MLYTRKGDDGSTTLFGCDQRMSKSSEIAEALGTVDELNALLGVIKTRADASVAVYQEKSYREILDDVQQDLFVVQAELAGADKHIDVTRVEKLEAWVNGVEATLPKITSFFVAGGSELAAYCDLARTVARRAERRVIQAREKEGKEEKTPMMAYLNRLSSLLYALERYANHSANIAEEKPRY